MDFIPATEFTDPDITGVSELIKNRLYFVTYKNKIPEGTKKVHFFTAIDEYRSDENSEPTSRLSLGTIFEFIKLLKKKLANEKHRGKVIVNYSTGSERKRLHASVMMGVYAVAHLNLTTEEVADKLSQHSTNSPLDFLKGFQKGITVGFLNFHSFDAEDFYSLDDVKLNWVIPNKILMFNGPIAESSKRYLSPRRYIEIFRYMGVQTIIRFHHIKYDANPFVGADFPHYDINIIGSVPTNKVLEIFLELSEECEGVVLVHCRELLGRAGCVVAAYLIKHFGLLADEAAAWVKLCTPECILDVQRSWLKDKEAALVTAGREHCKSRGCEQWPPVCGGRKEVPAQICRDESYKESSSSMDVTAQLENEIRVLKHFESANGIEEPIANFV